MIPISAMRARISSLVIESFGGLETKDGGSKQAPATHRFAKLLERSQVSRDDLAPGKLRSAITAFSVQKIEQARGATSIGVFTNVSALLRHLEIAGAVVVGDAVAGLKCLKGVPHVGHYLPLRRCLLLLRLGNDKVGPRDFTLITIEDRKRHANVESGGAET